MRFKELVETVPKGQPIYHNYVHTQWCYSNRKTWKQWGSSQTCECPTLPFFSLYNGSSDLKHVKFNKFEVATESYKKLQFLYAKVKTPYLLPHRNKLMNALNKWGRQFSAKDLFALRMASLLLCISRGHFTLQMFPEVEKTCQFNKRKRLETSDIQLFGQRPNNASSLLREKSGGSILNKNFVSQYYLPLPSRRTLQSWRKIRNQKRAERPKPTPTPNGDLNSMTSTSVRVS